MTIAGMDWQDSLALAFFVLCWGGYSLYSDQETNAKHALVNATNRWRLQWMREMLGRENRSVDAITVGNLTRSFTFFASTTIFILAALVSMLSLQEKANVIIQDIPFAKISGPGMWQIKISLLILIFTFGFFKFTWSMRQYNYVSIFIAAVPDYRVRKDEHEKLAQTGAALTSNAARHFNNGCACHLPP